MATDVKLVTTRAVFSDALDRVAKVVPRSELSSLGYVPTSLSDSLLQITASASTGRTAVRWADSVAAAFLDFRKNQFLELSRANVRSLEDARDALTKERDDLKANGLPAATGAVPASPTTDLATRIGELDRQLTEVRRQLDVSAAETFAVDTSQVIDPATSAFQSKKRAAAVNVATAIVGAGAAGAGWIVVSEILSDRVRRREDASAALGAPVAVSIGPLPGPGALRRRFRHGPTKGQGEIDRVVRHLRESLPARSGDRPASAPASGGTIAGSGELSHPGFHIADHGELVVARRWFEATPPAAVPPGDGDSPLRDGHVRLSGGEPDGATGQPDHRTGPGGALLIVSIDCRVPAAVAVASLAVKMVLDGKSVLVADVSDHSELAGLFGVRATEISTRHFGDSTVPLWLAFPSPESSGSVDDTDLDTQILQLRQQADLVLTLTTLDPAVGAFHLAAWAQTAVAVAAVGHTKVETLRAAAQMIRSAGINLGSAALVGTDKNDDTAGLPDLPQVPSHVDGPPLRVNE